MKDLGSMNTIELKDELKREKEWLKECERNAMLSRAQIKHLEACIKARERGRMKTKKIYYYTLESMDGRVYFGTSTKRLAKKHYAEASNDGICYKRIVGNNSYKKFMFMW